MEVAEDAGHHVGEICRALCFEVTNPATQTAPVVVLEDFVTEYRLPNAAAEGELSVSDTSSLTEDSGIAAMPETKNFRANAAPPPLADENGAIQQPRVGESVAPAALGGAYVNLQELGSVAESSQNSQSQATVGMRIDSDIA